MVNGAHTTFTLSCILCDWRVLINLGAQEPDRDKLRAVVVAHHKTHNGGGCGCRYCGVDAGKCVDLNDRETCMHCGWETPHE